MIERGLNDQSRHSEDYRVTPSFRGQQSDCELLTFDGRGVHHVSGTWSVDLGQSLSLACLLNDRTVQPIGGHQEVGLGPTASTVADHTSLVSEAPYDKACIRLL